jgi:sulfatase maturation enzyme AslB (radical SAM superfamily)
MNSRGLAKSFKAFMGWTDKNNEIGLRREEEELSQAKRLEERNRSLYSTDVPKAPLILRIEVVNLCNADCVFCAYQYQERAIETMSFDVFKRAIDQFTSLGGTHLCFAPVVGEALIDRKLEEKVAYARQFPQYERLELWTNAILLTRKRFEALVDAGITEFYISMSGFSAAEYKELYRNNNYAKVIRNLNEIAQSSALKKVQFAIVARTSSPAPEQEPDYIKMRDVFTIVFKSEMFSWHGQIKENDLPGSMSIIDGPRDQTKPCFFLWAGFTVMSNGDMTVCGCTDTDGVGLPLGNIQDVPIDAHLRDGRWLKLRDGFMAGTPPDFCKGCDMYSAHDISARNSASP